MVLWSELYPYIPVRKPQVSVFGDRTTEKKIKIPRLGP